MIENVSYTSLRTFATCPRAWSYRYLRGIEPEPTIKAYTGIMVHEALHRYYACEAEDPIQFLVKNWERQLEPEYLDDAIRMTALYQKSGPQRSSILAAEQRFAGLGIGLGLPVAGRIDLITQDGVVIDLKTAWSAFDPARYQLQANIYLAVARQVLERQDITFEFHVLRPLQRPKLEVFPAQEEPGWKEKARELIAGMCSGYYPRREYDWYCNSACQYADLCDQEDEVP